MCGQKWSCSEDRLIVDFSLLWDLKRKIKTQIVRLIVLVYLNLFSMKTVNSAQVVLWGLKEFWERQLDGKSKYQEMTHLLREGVLTKKMKILNYWNVADITELLMLTHSKQFQGMKASILTVNVFCQLHLKLLPNTLTFKAIGFKCQRLVIT